MLQTTPLELRSAATPGLLERGCVNVIGFEAIREEAGPRWPKLRESVVSRLEGLLRHALSPTDFFAPFDETSYLVTMPAADAQDVNIVCLRVAYELHKSLLGRCDLGQIRVSTARHAGADLLALRQISAEEIVAFAERAGIHHFTAAPYAGHDVARIASGGRSEASDSNCRFVPVWDTKNDAITSYLCESRGHRNGFSESISSHLVSTKDRVAAEIASLHTGIGELTRNLRSGERSLLGIPVTFEMIGSPLGRMELTSACRHLLAEHRQYLVFTLTNVPPGVAQTRLADITNTLRPFARHVLATVAPSSRTYAAYQGIGLQAIGLDLDENPSHPRTEADIARLALAARAMKLGTFLYGLSSPDALQIARETNIRWLAGDAVAPPLPRLQAMRRLTWDTLRSESFETAVA